MAAVQQQIRLAQSLPPRLLNLFRKFPPPQLSAITTTTGGKQQSNDQTISIASTTSPDDPNHDPTVTIPVNPVAADDNQSGRKTNPFLPFRNPRTGVWHGPHYSLRRQAELFKLAQQHGVLSLMPESGKHPEVKARKRRELGLRVQGTGEGRRVKGKAWERSMQSRLEERRRAMEGMPEMIRAWKERGHGRGWKKWPR